MSTPEERAAMIRKATREAQESLRRFDRDQIRRLLRVHEDAAADLRRMVRDLADDTGNIRLSVLQELLRQVEARLTTLSSLWTSELPEALTQAATIGANAALAAGASGLAATAVATSAVDFVTNFTARDGLQLSDRLWRVDQGAKGLMAREVRRAVILGDSASAAAARLLRDGQPVPDDIQTQARLNSAANLERVTTERIMTGEMNAYEQARRVFRTEINRAHGEAYRGGLRDNPDVIGEKFTLSPNHRIRDICDMHARVDLHGLGPGVYPVGRSPWPAHPNTLSFVVAVFRDEAPETPEPQSRFEWLQNESPSIQEAVLGSAQKRRAFADGVLEESDIDRPWREIEPRLQQQGYSQDEAA